jgi:hypothetical protein
VLPKAGDDLPGRIRQKNGVVAFRLADGTGEIAWLVNRVRVRKEQPSPFCLLCGGPAGIILPCKADGIRR